MEKEKIIKELKDIITHHENVIYYSVSVVNWRLEVDYDKLADWRMETRRKIENLFN